MTAPAAEGPSILVAMPLYEGWDHVGEALDSIARQSHRNVRVLVSVDGGDERSLAACAAYAKDSRFELVLQPARLRWEGNMNWLAGQLREDFFCYWQHDDHCAPDYLEILARHAIAHPEAASVYCDMQCFGTRSDVIQYHSVTGFALERVLKQAAVNNPAPIRCLIRAAALRASLPIGLATTWAIALARAGELHRVPQTLYFRRFRPESLGAQMRARVPAELWAATLDWALGLIANARPLVQPEEELRLVAMIVDQLVNRRFRGLWQYDFTAASQAERRRFVGELLRAARQRAGLSPGRLEAARVLATLPGAALVLEALAADPA